MLMRKRTCGQAETIITRQVEQTSLFPERAPLQCCEQVFFNFSGALRELGSTLKAPQSKDCFCLVNTVSGGSPWILVAEMGETERESAAFLRPHALLARTLGNSEDLFFVHNGAPL